LSAIESAYVYLFDCFEKSDDQNQNQRLYAEIVADLFNLTGVLPREYEPARNPLNVDEMTMAAEETMSVWVIDDLQTLLQNAERLSNESSVRSDIQLTRQMVSNIRIFWSDKLVKLYYSIFER
jgi:hypothetical protein